MWTTLIALLIFAVVKTFAGEKNREYRKIFLGIRRKSIKHKVHGKLYYAFHKSFALQKTGYLVAGWLVAVVIFHLSFTKPADLTDYYYKDYTTDNSGAVTAQTDEVIRIDEELMSSDTTIERMQEIQGELQRVAIARALVKRPRILLCDEPTGALDSETGKRILKLLKETAKENKISLIVVTHNANLEKIADQVIRLKDGKIQSCLMNEHPMSIDEVEW